MKVLVSLLFATLLAASCGRAGLEPYPHGDDVLPERGQSLRFVGQWYVTDGVIRGGQTADGYEFHADGRVEGISVFSTTLAGVVTYCEEPQSYCPDFAADIVCVFGDRWYSLDDQRLVLAGVCDDDEAREIELLFPEDSSQNADPGLILVTLQAVAGEADWNPLLVADGVTRGFLFTRSETDL